MVEDRREDLDEKARQQRQLVFDAFKHFTTLDTAAAVIVVTIFRDLGVGFVGASPSLTLFGGSLVSCAYGMLLIATGGRVGEFSGGTWNEEVAIRARGFLRFGVFTFLAGLLWAVLNVLYRT